MDYIPVEIELAILDYIDDIRSVINCMFVCRQWYEYIQICNEKHKKYILSGGYKKLYGSFIPLGKICHYAEDASLRNCNINWRELLPTYALNCIMRLSLKDIATVVNMIEHDIKIMTKKLLGIDANVNYAIGYRNTIKLTTDSYILNISRREIYVNSRGWTCSIHWNRTTVSIKTLYRLGLDINMSGSEFMEKMLNFWDFLP